MLLSGRKAAEIALAELARQPEAAASDAAGL